MTKRTIVFVLSICAFIRVCGQFPDLSGYTILSEGTVSFNYQCDGLESFTNGCNFEAQKISRCSWLKQVISTQKSYIMPAAILVETIAH